MKKLVVLALSGGMLLAPSAFAHSDYWRCAVAAGSADQVEANCGTRADYDNQQRQRAQEEYERNERQRRWEEERREREEYDRRERDRYERERDEYERRQRDSYTPSYPSEPSYPSRPSRPSQPSLPAQFKVKTYEVYSVTDASLSVGAKLNLQEYHGMQITKVELDIETPGPAKIEIYVQGNLVDTLEADRSDVYKKSLDLLAVKIDRNLSNLVLKVTGVATLKKATLSIQRKFKAQSVETVF